MENKQNSSGNSGFGNIGNNINNQYQNHKLISTEKEAILKDLHKNISKLDDLYKFNTHKVKTNKFSYAKIFIIVLFGAIIFWTLAVVSYKFFGFEINSTNIVLTLVGIVAAFVVISNYMQVYEVKNEVRDFYTNVEKEVREIVIDNLSELKHSVFASIYHLQGYVYYTEKCAPDALECYMKALNEINSTSNKEQLEHLIANIVCVLTDDNVIRISNQNRIDYMNTVIKSGSNSTAEILDYINYLDVAP